MSIVYESGFQTIDASSTSYEWTFAGSHSGYPAIEFGTTSDLRGTISTSYDGENYVDLGVVDSRGVGYLPGAEIVGASGLIAYFNDDSGEKIKFTRTAGSGTVKLLRFDDGSSQMGARMVQMLGTDGVQKIRGADSTSCDAFGRWRVSSPTTLFDSKLVNLDDLPLFWDEQLESGSGVAASTPTADKPYIDFTSTDSTAGVMTRQTFRRFNYQPGKSQLVLMTGVLNLSGGGTGVQRRIGLFDDDNGVFFEDDAGTFGVTVRTKDSGSAVDITASQADWNKDTLDGSGDQNNPSGLTADFAKSQIFLIDFQWLGAGRVRFGLEVGGVKVYVHEVNNANAKTIPWASTPCLPLRYQMVTTSSSPASVMRVMCSSVVSEGGADDTGILRHNSTAGTQVDMDTEGTLYAVKGIRLKATHLGTSVKIVKTSLSLQSNSDTIEWVLIFDPAIAGSKTWTAQTNSSVETLTGVAGNTVTGGVHIDAGYVSTGTASSSSGGTETEAENALLLGSLIDGTQQTIILAARPIDGSSTDVLVEGGLTWRELL